MKFPEFKRWVAISAAGALGSAIMYLIIINWGAVVNQSTTAKSADSFVDFVGINTHIPQTDSAYGNFSRVKAALQDLGVRHIRDNAWDHNNPGYYDKLKQLSAVGIKSTLFFHGQSPQDAVSLVKSLASTVEAVEGPNETDLDWLSPLIYNGLFFPKGTQTYQNDLYTAFNNDAAVTALPVLLPSMGWGKGAEVLCERSLNSAVSGYCPAAAGDVGNMHSYPDQGNMPSIHLDDWYLPFVRLIAGSAKPIWSTETGYSTLLSNPSGVSEAVQAKYTLRLLLEHWNRDVKRTYLYQLIDPKPPVNQGRFDHIGLLRYDGSKKPVYGALKNLIYFLGDKGTAKFTPGAITFSLDGDTNNVHYALFQKAASKQHPTRYFFVVWQESQSWNNQTKQDIVVPPRKLTLRLINTKIRQAAYYSPLSSPNMTMERKSTTGFASLTLNVPDHPLIVKLVP